MNPSSFLVPVPDVSAHRLPDRSRLVQFQLSGYRIGIQAGHGRGDSGAPSCDDTVHEAEITAAVAGLTAELLRFYGAQVDLFTGLDPGLTGYQADAFAALHTDYCPDPDNPSRPTGYKVARYGGIAGTGLNGSGDASDQLVLSFWDQYGVATGLPQDREPGHFTPGMLSNYALDWIDSSTPGIIIEMGWLSGDLDILVNGQDRIAAGIANSIALFLVGNAPPPTSGSATVLLLDVSGSMAAAWQGGVKIESAKNAAIDVINMLEQENQVIPGGAHQVAVATFTTDAQLDLPLTMDAATARQVVNGLTPQQNTNIGAGLQVSNQALASAPTGVRKVIILLSDGLTNAGLTREQILAGPVQEAAAAGTCIYTVGFGDPGNLDEGFLREIAASAACGNYNHASSGIHLESLYIALRHQSLGQILGQFQGQVAHGAQVQAGTVDVPPGQGELYASLYWPGSTLGLVLTDPQGQAVDPNYPGANISNYERLQYVVVSQPQIGTWDIAVVGQDVPQGTTSYDVVLSSRAAPPTPTPPPSPTPLPTETPLPPTATPTAVVIPTVIPTPTVVVEESGGGVGTALVFLIGIVGAVGLLVLATTRGRARSTTGTAPVVAGQARLIIRSGPGAGQVYRVGPRGVSIGRGRASDVQLVGTEISRRHAVIRPARGRFFLQDQGSAVGTYLNGQRVEAAPLSEGDVIQIGNVKLEFHRG